jgi:hypothetical protein
MFEILKGMSLINHSVLAYCGVGKMNLHIFSWFGTSLGLIHALYSPLFFDLGFGDVKPNEVM